MSFKLAWKQKYYEKRKHLIDSIKMASGCVVCGMEGPAEVLTFDHVRGEKLFDIGSRWDVGIAKLEDEVGKCEVVCANCHAIRTKDRFQAGPEFFKFKKIPRLNRDMIVTEKIDGTNSKIWIDSDWNVWAGSRNRWIVPEDDNFGFAKWVEQNANDLRDGLGQGVQFGEWWGQGIQRRYDLKEKRFSLFNVSKWGNPLDRPDCCHCVPVLYEGPFSTGDVMALLRGLRARGSKAAPGFMDPEGLVVFHTAAGQYFKVTCKDDETPKALIGISL